MSRGVLVVERRRCSELQIGQVCDEGIHGRLGSVYVQSLAMS